MIVNNKVKSVIKNILLIMGTMMLMNCNTYFNYVAKGYSTDAKTAIKSIVQASEMYYNERGEYPINCIDDLRSGGFIDLKRSTMNKWEFECALDEDGGWIEAYSTEEMSGGAGHRIYFDRYTGEFTGYGQKNKE